MQHGVVYGIFISPAAGQAGPGDRLVYIGSSADYWARWGRHMGALRRGAHGSAALQAAFTRFGERSVRWLILEWVGACTSRHLADREKVWIAEYLARVGPGRVFNHVYVPSKSSAK